MWYRPGERQWSRNESSFLLFDDCGVAWMTSEKVWLTAVGSLCALMCWYQE